MGIRIIDANAAKKSLLSYYSFVNENTTKANYTGETLMSYEVADMIEDCMDNTPTIDPETLPIVQELRKQLERVTAERDAAVSDIETMLAYGTGYNGSCPFCKNPQCYARGGTKPCLPKWRGPVAENATAGNGGQNDD